MYKELKSIKNKNQFQFDLNDNLEEVCNAPDAACGIFLVYDISNEVKELIMVGLELPLYNFRLIIVQVRLYQEYKLQLFLSRILVYLNLIG